MSADTSTRFTAVYAGKEFQPIASLKILSKCVDREISNEVECGRSTPPQVLNQTGRHCALKVTG